MRADEHEGPVRVSVDTDHDDATAYGYVAVDGDAVVVEQRRGRLLDLDPRRPDTESLSSPVVHCDGLFGRFERRASFSALNSLNALFSAATTSLGRFFDPFGRPRFFYGVAAAVVASTATIGRSLRGRPRFRFVETSFPFAGFTTVPGHLKFAVACCFASSS